MSWLGVNLNDSINSLKGQISSFTNVMTDDDGIADHIEVVVPKKRIKEYEKSIALYQEEIKELKNYRAEAGERIRAEDYNYSNKIASLTKQLHETQEELENLRSKTAEWKWDAGSEDSKKQYNQSNAAEDSSVYIEQISFLQIKLAEEKRRREEEILAIQETHALKLNTAKDARHKPSTAFTNVSLNDDYFDNEKDRKIKELEEELYSLRSDYESLCEEKEQLNTNLVDLDSQHQIIIDEILRSKKVLTDELKQTKSELSELRNSSAQLQEKESEQVITLKEQIDTLVHDKSTLVEDLTDLKRHQDESFKHFEEFQQVNYAQKEEIEQLKQEIEENKHLSSIENGRLETLIKDLDDSNLRITLFNDELKNANRREDENEKTIHDLKSQILNLKGDDDRATKIINELNNSITYKDEEILKLEAVIEEKTNEHVNTFRKLKQQEEMTLITIKEFQKENQDLKNEIQELKQYSELEHNKISKETKESSQKQTNLEKILKDMIEKCNLQRADELPPFVAELNSEVASLRCERDHLSDELKDVQELADSLVMEKNDLERECEDLRDQLEELQCGERVLPEGSVTPRPLPTIEEEEADISHTAPSDAEVTQDKRTVEGSGNSELHERINELNSQVAALGEARQNLEMELSIVKRERVDLEQRLAEANSQLGNLSNLEAEAVNLRNENESLQHRLHDSKKHLEGLNHVQEEKFQLQQQIQYMTNAVNRMNLETSNLLTHQEVDRLKASWENKLTQQSTIIEENNKEISRLRAIETNNTSAHIEQYEEKISDLESQLDKVKGLVIYKDDQIDQLKHGIEQIGIIFNLRSSDLRDTYVHIKQEHDSLLRQANQASIELQSLGKENEKQRNEFTERNANENEIIQKLSLEKQTLNEQLNEIKNDFDNLSLSSQAMAEKFTRTLNDLQAQNEELLREKSALQQKVNLNTNDKATLESQIQTITEKCRNLESYLESKEKVISQLQAEVSEKEETLNAKIRDLEAQLLSEEEHSNGEASLEIQLRHTIELLGQEKEDLKNRISELNSERLQMIDTSTKKHQESVTYYNEIQRLNEVLQNEDHRTATEISLLKQKLQGLQQECIEKQKISDELCIVNQNLERTLENSLPKLELTKVQHENAQLKEEVQILNEKVKKQQEAHRNVLKERDHLRLANSSFNSQYEEKSREANALQEKEKHQTQEVQRLKQHLVEVEETYTNEAVKSEQREHSLRQSLAKMHEKISSHSSHYSNENQKTQAQLESMQERLNEAVHQRDEAKTQHQIAEEASLQHQEALTRLQQVLQDFQKNQGREISMATEREKRKLEEEKKKNAELEIQLKMINAKLKELESTVSTSAALKDELQTKEDMIVALKSQVNAVNLAAKKSQEQVALLKSYADGKVDKHLLRNLFVGYFATPFDKQREVLRIVAEVLDFSPEERSRTGIDQQPGSWLTSIANFLAPPPSNIRIASKVDVLDHSSLSQAFIRFLEEESSPRTHPKLPAVQMAEEANQKAQKKAQSKNFIGKTNIDPAHSAFAHLAQNQPEVTNSLLTNASSLQTNFSLISTTTLSPAPPLSSTEDVSTPKFLNNLLNSNNDKEAESETNQTENL